MAVWLERDVVDAEVGELEQVDGEGQVYVRRGKVLFATPLAGAVAERKGLREALDVELARAVAREQAQQEQDA